jgi:hypothetical protein
MDRIIYLQSYDRYNEILKYHLPSGEFSVLMEENFKPLGLPMTMGRFCNEGPDVAGLFASPDGPVFFFNQRQVVCRFGETSASVAAIPGESKNRFTFIHKPANGEAVELSLVYKQRLGLYANPYDNEEEDIDLLALIVSNLRFEAAFRAYTKEWAIPEAKG